MTMTMHCPDVTCRRPLGLVPGHDPGPRWVCPRCGTEVHQPAPARAAQIAAGRATAVRKAAASNPALRAAFIAWKDGDAYWDGKGYRLKSNRGKRAPWSRLVVERYPQLEDFHEAASAAVRA